MTIGELIALIMLHGKDNSWTMGVTVDMIDCTDDAICIYPSGGSPIEISKSDYLKEEE